MKVIKANFRIEFEPEITVMGDCSGAIGENARGCLLLHSLQVSVTTELNVKGDGNTQLPHVDTLLPQYALFCRSARFVQ